MLIKTLRLKKDEDRRLQAGHLWIFSNEIDVKQSPLTNFSPGEEVIIESSRRKILGYGYINPHALLCARLISRNSHDRLDKKLLTDRLQKALQCREQLFTQPFYRLVFGEADYLPGLVIDRFNDVLVVQITTAGMEKVAPLIREVLIELFQPRGILLRNDSSIRTLENLPLETLVWHGDVPEKILLHENNAKFYAPLISGQKTGWFYDHRSSRARLQNYVVNRRVLDVFSYCGSWGIQAATFGAQHVICVDSSAQALQLVEENAALNKVAGKVSMLCDDAFVALNHLHAQQALFDVIILDPPAFIKKRKDHKEGYQAYRRLNELAVRLLKPDGILITASCSQHLSRDDLLNIVRQTTSQQGYFAQILEEGHQAPDHPIHPAIPETSYLKTFFVRVVK